MKNRGRILSSGPTRQNAPDAFLMRAVHFLAQFIANSMKAPHLGRSYCKDNPQYPYRAINTGGLASKECQAAVCLGLALSF